MTRGGNPPAITSPYHRALTIDGREVSFNHLEPIQIAFRIDRLGRDLTVDVRFSNHCFSETFVPGRHDVAHVVMDGERVRAFSFDRYELSMRLPAMIASLQIASVWQTRSGRNYVYFLILGDGENSYPMFFNVRRKRDYGADLSLFVESAYPVSSAQAKQITAMAQKVSFPVVCSKIYRGMAIRASARR